MNKNKKRVFLIVLDSFGIGRMEDAHEYGDGDVNTLRSVSKSPFFSMPNMERLGLFHIDGVEVKTTKKEPVAAYARLKEASKGKDTTTGHWEIAGIYSKNPMPTYPEGFPQEILEAFSRATGKGVLCNKPYSGTQVIQDYGEKHRKTGD